MAQAVTEAINLKQELVVEAGTGTGKTFTYLAPAQRRSQSDHSTGSKKRRRISCGARDSLPTVCRAEDKGKLALLKGRPNYPCSSVLSNSRWPAELAGQTLIDSSATAYGRRRLKRVHQHP